MWVMKNPMNAERVYSNAVVLPTRQVFIVGGSWVDPQNDSTLATPQNPAEHQPVILAELYDPGPNAGSGATPNGSTTYLNAPNQGIDTSNGAPPPSGFPWTPRVYHTVAILLADGRLLVAGGENVDNFPGVGHLPASAWSAEILSPPYLFQGDRPKIYDLPDAAYLSGSSANTFAMTVGLSESPAGAAIDRIVLIRPGAVTHHFDMEQRYLELDFTIAGQSSAGIRVEVSAPPENLAPPGHYMLFVLRDDPTNPAWRVPSVARFIRFD